MNPFTATTTAARASVVLVAGILLSLVAMTMPAIAGASTPTTNQCQRSALLVPSCGVLWGAYVPVGSGQNWTTAVTSLESQIGRNFDIVYHYHDFSGPVGSSGSIPDSFEKTLGASGHIIFDNWQSRIYSTGQELSWADIAAGDYDSSVVIPTALAIKAYGTPIMVSFDHEMDRMVGPSGTAADYVAAYRHIHDVFAAEGVTNVIWVWTTTGFSARFSMFPSLYPGNSYVDWIGYDPYNFYTCPNTNGSWQSFKQIIAPMYQWLESNGYGDKPFILPEYGTLANPSDSTAAATWYAAIPSVLPSYPNLKALVQWDEIDPQTCDFRLTQPGELSAYAQTSLSPQVIGAQAPAVPSAPSISGVTSTSATVNWTAVAGASSYQVQRSVSGANTFTNVGSPVAASSLADSGLTPGASYDYRVLAMNVAGSSAPSPVATVTLFPGQPGALTAATIGTGEVDLSWTAAGGANTYTVERSPSGAGTWSVLSSGLTGTTFADTSVSQMTSYDYRVVAVGTAGSGAWSSTLSVTTSQAVPAQVTGVTAAAAAPTEVDLSWQSAPTATAYEIERSSTSASGGYTPLTTSATATSYADTSASPQTTYWYEIVAHNGGGWGPASTDVAAATPAVNNALLSNTFEGGTGSVAITAANSGGGSGNALDRVVCSAGSPTYNGSAAAHGKYSALISPTTQLCYLGWSTKSIATTGAAYGRASIELGSDPAASLAVLKVDNPSGVRDAQITVTPAGKLALVDASGASRVTFGTSIPLNQWVRVEWHLVSGPSGSFQVRIFAGDATTPIESETVPVMNAGTSIGAYRVGMVSTSSAAVGTTIGVDDLAYGTAGWIGPASH